MRRENAFLLGFLAVVLINTVFQPLLGQTTGRGEVRGVVRDQNQLPVPGADVTVVNQSTNLRRSTVTSDVGVYFVGALPIGRYQMAVQMPGFKEWTSQLELQVGQTQVVNPQLLLGQISEIVEVTDSVSLVPGLATDIADVKDFDRIQQLPLNGRTITSLFDLTPGVEGASSVIALRRGSINYARVLGAKVGSLEITLDGISMVDRFGGGMARVQPGLDTIQEFRIETVGSDARFSRPSSVTLVSRSGTNEFHGSAFWTHRNNGAGLRSRRREEGDEASRLLRHEFGATAGGPLWLGDLYDGRDKTFWFFSYEGQRHDNSRRAFPRRVPTEAMWSGDLSNMVDANGNLTTIYNPFTTRADGTREQFPNNTVPQALFHPFGRQLADMTARPLDTAKNPFRADNFNKFYPENSNVNTWTIKGDQVLSENDNLSVRLTRSTRKYVLGGGVFGNPREAEFGFGTSRGNATVHNLSANWNRTFSPSFLNELLVGVNRSYSSYGNVADSEAWADTLGLPNPLWASGWPTYWTLGSPQSFMWDSNNREDEALTGTVVENNATWVRGNHVLQFGGKLRWEQNNIRELQQMQGSHDSDGQWSALYNPNDENRTSRTGHGFADMLMGLGTYFSANLRPGFYYLRQRETGLYVNDKWKVSPRLTLNVGLRWDHWTPYREKRNRLTGIDDRNVFTKFEVITPGSSKMEDLADLPAGALASWAARGLTWTTADSVGYPSGLFASDTNNIGPRIGVSYQLTDKTVMRGSYGEYFWPMPLSLMLGPLETQPPFDTRFRTDLKEKDETELYPLMNHPVAGEDFVEDIVIDTEGVVQLSKTARQGTFWDGRGWKDAHARSWHLTLEHELMRNTALRFSYTGLQGRDLEQNFSINSRLGQYNYVAKTGLKPPPPSGVAADKLRPNPDWNLFASTNRTGYSNTHTGQVEIERRFSQGVGFQFFYVFTRSLTSSDAGGFQPIRGDIKRTDGRTQVPEHAVLFQYPNELGYSHFSSSPGYDELLRMAYFSSANIPPHRIRYNAIIDLPFGTGKRFGKDVSGAVDQLIGGWQIALIGDWRSGFRRSVNPSKWVWNVKNPFLGKDERIEMFIFGERRRLHFRGDFDPSRAEDVDGGREALEALVPQDPYKRAVRQAGSNLDNRLEQPLAEGGTINTSITDLYNPLPRNSYMGTGAWVVDLAIFKHFYITEDLRLRFTADFFNFFNNPNDTDPNTSTGLVNLGESLAEPRTIQLSLRLDW